MQQGHYGYYFNHDVCSGCAVQGTSQFHSITIQECYIWIFQQCFAYFITVVVIITIIDASFAPQEYTLQHGL